jgi:NDP-sugar pyrophosphorylase family protein
MNDIRLLGAESIGVGFVPPEYLRPGEDEYSLRNEQIRSLGKTPESYRRLRPYELESLVKNENTCPDWSSVLVSDPFNPELVKQSAFAGLVRLGRLERAVLEHHDTRVPVGIYNSRITACDIGDDCAILDCAYLAHYIVGDGCILMNNDEISASNHAKYGNGILKEGESEEVRVELDLMNEAGGRSILPFDGMLTADAYLWARHRGDAKLMAAFRAMTEAMFDRRRGRYGLIGGHSVLKSNGVIKDVAIGECAYIKGSNKLKNLTVRSSEEARTQIGEGVELVNGIVGYGCRVFYGCKAVRFVMGDNSALKYGARLIHSVLGENSTVSCCEILNNLIFPAHEQHHNTSFLIASLVRGQSNMAAGATIGSNHNSRSNDGEIEAGRGFWPGLSTSVKHSSRFASYCLLSKGDYRYELDLRLPFCLVDDDQARDRLVLVPAYWWTHNLYALMRNEAKFEARDHRVNKDLRIEFSPFAPDTAEECIEAIGLLEEWTGAALAREEGLESASLSREERRLRGAAALADPRRAIPTEIDADGVENSTRPVIVIKPARAWKAYREILAWYAMGVLSETESGRFSELSRDLAASDRERGWDNLGGQLAPNAKIEEVLAAAREGRLPTWCELHAEYGRLAAEYPKDRARHAWSVLAWLRGKEPGRLSEAELREATEEFTRLASRIEEEVYRSRKKDHDNRFRRATYRSAAEMDAVVGRPEKNPFVLKTKKDMAIMRERAGTFAAGL